MPTESISKRCSCTQDGRPLGARCPRLRRPGGGWNPHHGTWRYQLELPPHPTGGRRQLRRSGFPDRDTTTREHDHAKHLLTLARGDSKVRDQIATLLQNCQPGDPLPDTDTVAARIAAGTATSPATTMADYLTTWLAGRRGLSPSTVKGYGDHIRLYLTPHLGHLTVQELDSHHIETMFTTLLDRNDTIRAAHASPDPTVRATVRGVRPLSASSLQRLRGTLRKVLNDAIHKHKLRTLNPAVGIELPSGRPPKARVWTDKHIDKWRTSGIRPSPVMVWRPQQAGQFLDHVERHDPALYPMFALILHRGLRRGEACGLRDEDVDLDHAHLTVAQQITTVQYRPITKPVKTDAGDRTIPLGPTTTAVLRDYLRIRQAWRAEAGTAWPDTGLFFVRPDGRAWHPALVSDRFEHAIRKSGLPPVRLHDLRHCAATYLRHGGADLKEIQQTLGHAQLAITADTYTSVILELQHTHADAAATLIPRTTPGPR